MTDVVLWTDFGLPSPVAMSGILICIKEGLVVHPNSLPLPPVQLIRAVNKPSLNERVIFSGPFQLSRVVVGIITLCLFPTSLWDAPFEVNSK